MFEALTFLVALAIIRALRRSRAAPPAPTSIRVDVYHHFDGGPGEQVPVEPTAIDDDRVVAFPRR